MPFSHVAGNVRICQKPPSNDGFSSARGMADIGDLPAIPGCGGERQLPAEADLPAFSDEVAPSE